MTQRGSLTPKNWGTFQHYKERKPPWIKLHHGLLDDFQFSCLPLASRALAPLLWLLASEYQTGEITASWEEIAFRLRVPVDHFVTYIEPLINAGFFVCASEALAECKHDAMPETERETETETEEETEYRGGRKTTRPINSDDFEKFWEAYPRRDGANPKAPAFKKFSAIVKSGTEPLEITAAAARYATEMRAKGQERTPYVAQALTWLNQQRWGDYSEAVAEKLFANITRVVPDTPQWEAWCQERGRPLPRDRDGGWWCPSEWPPTMHQRALDALLEAPYERPTNGED